MAIIGASKPMFAIYSHSGANVSYENGGVIGKLVEFSIDVESTNDNDFYADNGIAETQRNKFSSGSLSMQTDDLRQEISKVLLGLKEVTLSSVPGIEGTVTELVYDDDQNTPYLGIGMVQKKQIDNMNKWRAIVLKKIMFNVPADAATTEGESIDWQTPTVEATIMRDDSAKHEWKNEATFDSEEEAVAYIRYKLNIVASTNAKLQALSLGAVSLSPDFDADTTSYTASTSNATNTVTASAQDIGAEIEIKVNGTEIENGTPATWEDGPNTLTVKVTAADGTTVKTYTVTVTKS